MSVPRFSALLATRKYKASNTEEDSFTNIAANVQTYVDENEKIGLNASAPGIRKKSVFIEEGLAWGNWSEANRLDIARFITMFNILL